MQKYRILSAAQFSLFSLHSAMCKQSNRRTAFNIYLWMCQSVLLLSLSYWFKQTLFSWRGSQNYFRWRKQTTVQNEMKAQKGKSFCNEIKGESLRILHAMHSNRHAITATRIDQAFYLYYSTVKVSSTPPPPHAYTMILHNYLHISIIWFHTPSIYDHIALMNGIIFRRLHHVDYCCAFAFCTERQSTQRRDRKQSNPQIWNRRKSEKHFKP